MTEGQGTKDGEEGAWEREGKLEGIEGGRQTHRLKRQGSSEEMLTGGREQSS